jgi:hypothetical protein
MDIWQAAQPIAASSNSNLKLAMTPELTHTSHSIQAAWRGRANLRGVAP